MRSEWLTLLTGVLLAAGTVHAEWTPGPGRWVDLTHAYDEDTLYWPTSERFRKDTVFEGQADGGWYYTAYAFCTAEHGGTHIDAPVHFAEGREPVDQIPLSRLVAPAVVVDLRAAAAADPDYQASVSDLEAWEREHGRIPDGSIVLFDTGFAEHWPDPVRYMGTDQRGEDAVPLLHFPGIHPDAARWLAGQRKIAAVGLDTPSIDHGQSRDFMTHRILFEHNIPGLENVGSMAALPPLGAVVIALPMKIRGGSGAPVRIIAFVPGTGD